MKFISTILLCFFSLLSKAQQIQKTILFQDSFTSYENGWTAATLKKNGYESYISTDGRYICNLPINNEMGWNWTWVKLPDAVSQVIDTEEAIEMQFDWQVLTNQDDFRFGLMFDTHNVTNDCLGGDFRVIWITGDSDEIKTEFTQTKNCNSEVEWEYDGATVPIKTQNRLKLVKSKYNYTVFINGINVLTFDFKGSLNIDYLNYGRGTYAFDNFKLTRNTFSLPANTAQPIASTTGKPRIWILLAGIEKYRNQKPLNYTVDDISSMYSFWTSVSGGRIPSNQIAYLSDSDASSQKIIDNAKSLFWQASENDVIITFLSGHGGVGAFAAYDGSLEYDNLNQVIKASKARHKICIVDACHAGSLNNKNVLTQKGETLDANQALNLFYSALSKSGGGITYLLACKGDQLSTEAQDLQHGVFTYFLLQGMKGAADTNQDRLVTLQELFDYIKVKVPAYESDQNPVIKGTLDPDTPLAVLQN